MNRYSTLIESLVPDFVNEDHPNFVAFLKAYYEWLENSQTGEVGYFIEKSKFSRDVDESMASFIQYFKKEYLPYFPESVLIDERRLIKFAREFYQKKGTEDSFKFLFRVLFDKDIELFYPKQDILRASDGKWKLPQSIRLTISVENENFDVSLLDKRKAVGRESRAYARIEKAYSTVEKSTNIPIIELFVTNVDKLFQNGEIIDILYTDANGTEQTFSERLIGSISSIILDQTRKGTGYRGIERDSVTNAITYTGDPVVIYGGLNDSAGAIAASANITEVTQGSIDSLSLLRGGYGFRTFDNTYIDVVTSEGREANIRVIAVDTGNANVVYINTDYVGAYANVLLNAGTYGFANASGNINAQIINALTFSPISVSPIRVVQLYNGGLGFTVRPTIDAISTYDTVRTANTTPFVTLRQGIEILSSNASSLVLSGSFSSDSYAYAGNRVHFGNEIRKVALYDGTTKTITLNRPFVASLSSGADLYLDLRPDLKDLGILANVEIDAVGSNYSNSDTVLFTGGSGYNASANIVVNSLGEIQRVNLLNRGAGYYSAPSVTIVSGSGSGAMLSAYVYGDGEDISPITGKIGQIKTITLTNRGFDYISEPYVSLKIADLATTAYPDGSTISAGDIVYQGANVNSTTYIATVDKFFPLTGVVRVFDYSGNISLASNVKIANTSTSTEFQATIGSTTQYPANGSIAKARAEFLNGLIKYKGYFLNTDGFISADKKLQGPRKYHNFSYIVAIEQELASYEKIVKAILHPSGTVMFGLNYVVNTANLTPNAVASLGYSANNFGNVTVNANSTIIFGSNTRFTGNISANDMFVVNPNDSYRTRTFEILSVNGFNQLTAKATAKRLGDGRLNITTGNANVKIFMNTDPISASIYANDRITINTGSYTVVSVTGNVVRLNTATGLANANVLFDLSPTFANVEYKIIRQ